MSKIVKLNLKQKIIFDGEDGEYPIYSLSIECDDNEQVEVIVKDGVAYYFTHYGYIHIPLKDTPKKLSMNPDIRLCFVEETKEQ